MIEDRGAGKRPSVRCLTWRTLGTHSVEGDVEAGFVEARGTLSIGGSLRTADLSLQGTLDVVGGATATGRIEAQGTFRVGGPVAAAEIEGRGAIHAGATLAVHGLLKVAGRLEVAGEIVAQGVTLEGSVAALAGVRAQRFELTAENPCRLGLLRADSVRIARTRGPPWKRAPTIVVDRIEAREVDLEGVHCGFLVAESILLGKECRITRAEGNIVAQHRDAYVGFYSESAPPHGLSR
jgi:cytoskeletal protein CcmA (bactofilin family)